MVKSLRWRLQAWYALTLLAAIALFAVVLYRQAKAERMARIDARLAGAAGYLDAALRSFPRGELENDEPGGRGRKREPPRGPRRGPPDDPLGLGGPPDDPFDDGPPDGPPGRRRPPPRGPEPRGPEPRGPESRERALAGLDLLPKEPGETDLPSPYYAVWRATGSVLRATGPSSMKPPADAAEQLQFRTQDGDRQAYRLGPQRSAVLVGVPMAKETAAWTALAWRLTGAGAAALAVGLVGGWIVSARMMRPIGNIAETAASISETNLARRIDEGTLDEELVGLGRVLNETFARLEEAFERQSRFVADASHELRTPLAVLHANLELALSRTRSAEEYRATLETCLAASGRMRALADGLLTLARADAGRLDPQFRSVDVCEIAREAVARHSGAAKQASVALSAEMGGQAVVVRGDESMLARVLDNLISNALRHTPAKGRVRVTVAADGGEAVLTVADTGPGVADEDKPRIFERFFRADAARARATGGYGLGLAICEGLVKAHGGRIEVGNAPGGGAVFGVRLPMGG